MHPARYRNILAHTAGAASVVVCYSSIPVDAVPFPAGAVPNSALAIVAQDVVPNLGAVAFVADAVATFVAAFRPIAAVVSAAIVVVLAADVFHSPVDADPNLVMVVDIQVAAPSLDVAAYSVDAHARPFVAARPIASVVAATVVVLAAGVFRIPDDASPTLPARALPDAAVDAA